MFPNRSPSFTFIDDVFASARGQLASAMADPQFVSDLLGAAPGADAGSAAVQDALSSLSKGEDKEEEKTDTK